jgi:beta-lactamase regulating signal transducer with metallopeptidase domain
MTILPLHLQAVSTAFARAILISIAASIPLALFGWAWSELSVRHSSRGRFAMWYATLLMIFLFPVGLHLASAKFSNGVTTHSLITISSSWAIAGFALWAACAAVGLLRVVLGVLKVRSLRLSCRNINVAELDPLLQETLRELRPSRSTQVCVSDDLRVPTAIGFFAPRVILPSWLLKEIPASQLRAVLLHELAHIKRWDDFTNLLQKTLLAVLCFHPAVWWIDRQISLEREIACDDMVLERTENPRDYAECLIAVAEKSFVRRGFSLAQAAVGRMRQTSARIAQILDSKPTAGVSAWRPAVLALAAFSAFGLAVLPRLGELVAFSDSKPPALTAPEHSVSALVQPQLSPQSVVAHMPEAAIRPVSYHARLGRAPLPVQATNTSYRAVTLPWPSGNSQHARALQANATSSRQAVVTQTVFVVAQFGRDGDHPEFWTVHVWQLTIFKQTAPTDSTLPAKKV